MRTPGAALRPAFDRPDTERLAHPKNQTVRNQTGLNWTSRERHSFRLQRRIRRHEIFR